jgi:O-antigen ligase
LQQIGDRMTALFLRDITGRSFSGKEKTLYVMIALFFATIFLPDMPVINNIFTGLIFVCCLFFNSLRDKINLVRQRRAILFMIFFYLLHLVSALFSTNKHEAIRLLGMRIPLLMFPLSLGLICIRQELKERILLVYAFTTTVAALICLITAFMKYQATHDMQFLYNDNLTAVTLIQSIYFAQMVNLALFSYAYLLSKRSTAIQYKGLVYISILFLVAINFMLASRISIIVLYSALIIFAAFHLIKKRKFLEGITIVIGLMIGGFLMTKFFPKTLNRFKELSLTDYNFNSHGPESHFNMELTTDQWNGANIRLAVWKCGWDLARQNIVFGAQLGDKKDKMMEIYRARHFDFAVRTERNMHNNYLDVLCTFGIVGLILFLFGYFIFPLISCFYTGDILGICIIGAFAFVLVPETYLDRSLGCIFIGFFMSLVASYKRAVPG